MGSYAQEAVKLAPAFSLRDTSGTFVTLESFKGKIIFLDFWATWCGPCVAEIPHTKKLIKQFKEDSSIVFISISLDGDETKWKEIVQKRSLTGIQLISLKGKESDIIQSYSVNAIPRYMIVGKEGEFIDQDAPRPSNKKLDKLLYQLTH